MNGGVGPAGGRDDPTIRVTGDTNALNWSDGKVEYRTDRGPLGRGLSDARDPLRRPQNPRSHSWLPVVDGTAEAGRAGRLAAPPAVGTSDKCGSG